VEAKGTDEWILWMKFKGLERLFMLMSRRGSKPQERWLAAQVVGRVLTGTNSEGNDKLMRA
jgi:hypothetical protein